MMKPDKAAFLWNESFLWGLMAYRALRGLDLPFDLVRAEDIKNGALTGDYKMLFVPGGWASNKIRALGDRGINAVRKFVENGGSYLGFCGGAGLATKAKGCIGLLDIKRRPTKERVPSFSGRIHVNVNEHPIWNGVTKLRTPDSKLIFHAWWPSQFVVEGDDINIVATYGDALPDAFSSDLNVGDVESNGSWEELEHLYGINLDPSRLKNEPCVLEGRHGKGKVLLSLIHFDTPDDENGHRVLENLWEYLGDKKVRSQQSGVNSQKLKVKSQDDRNVLKECVDLCSDLISLGERNFLWFWRNSMLLQWRRGVRGLEYNTLYILMKEISEKISVNELLPPFNSPVDAARIKNLLVPFIEKAKRLLILERHAIQKGHITYEKCDDTEIRRIRDDLFSKSKSYDGMFKELLDEIDNLLFMHIKP